MSETESQPTTFDLFSIADRLRALREQKDSITATLKAVKEEIQSAEQELSDVMAATECQNFTRDGNMFILTTTSYWSAAEGGTEALYAALREKGHADLFTVQTKKLGAFLREAVNATEDENGETYVPGWLDGLIKNYDKTGITMKPAPQKTKK